MLFKHTFPNSFPGKGYLFLYNCLKQSGQVSSDKHGNQGPGSQATSTPLTNFLGVFPWTVVCPILLHVCMLHPSLSVVPTFLLLSKEIIKRRCKKSKWGVLTWSKLPSNKVLIVCSVSKLQSCKATETSSWLCPVTSATWNQVQL